MSYERMCEAQAALAPSINVAISHRRKHRIRVCMVQSSKIDRELIHKISLNVYP
jgi:hypothetical protein